MQKKGKDAIHTGVEEVREDKERVKQLIADKCENNYTQGWTAE